MKPIRPTKSHAGKKSPRGKKSPTKKQPRPGRQVRRRPPPRRSPAGWIDRVIAALPKVGEFLQVVARVVIQLVLFWRSR